MTIASLFGNNVGSSSGNVLTINSVTVSEAYQGQGIGDKLVSDVALVAVLGGAKRLAAHPLKGAQPFYERLGFAPVPTFGGRERWERSIFD